MRMVIVRLMVLSLLWLVPRLGQAGEIHDAAKAGDLTRVRSLLQANPALVVATDQDGNTPLHVAAQAGRKETAELLLSFKANPQAKNRLGFKPLDLVRGRENDALAALLEQHLAAAAPSLPAEVGVLGDPKLISFQGNKTFSAVTLRDGLLVNPEFLTAAHPGAPLDVYLETIRRKLVDGYQNEGFPDVRVTLKLQAGGGNIQVDIVEGPRFFNGAIQVAGARTLSADALIQRLTQPWPPPGIKRFDKAGNPIQTESQEPLWTKGEPAGFSVQGDRASHESMKSILAELGLFFPKFKLPLVRNPATGTADLRVEILDEGPPGVISEIDVSGHQRNSREDILKLLELKPGMTLSHERIEDAERRLWRSARFLSFTLETELTATNRAAAGRIKLAIRVREYSKAPPLAQALTPEQQALLKLGDWLNGFGERKEDLVLTTYGTNFLGFHEARVEMIISPTHGVLFQGQDSLAPSASAGLALIMGTDQYALYALARRRKVVTRPLGRSLIPFLSLAPDASATEEKFSVTVGAGFSTLSPQRTANGSAVPLAMKLNLAPVAFLKPVVSGETACTLRGRTLVISNAEVQATVDADSGRLLTLQGEGDLSGSLTFESGAFTARKQALDAATVADQTRADGHSAFSTLLAFLFHEGAQLRWPGRAQSGAASSLFSEAATAALEAIVVKQVMVLGDQLSTALESLGKSEFTIPPDKLGEPSEAMNVLITQMAAYGFKLSNDLFPQRSWPWTVTHGAVAVFSGGGKYVEPELERIYESDETGPLGFLTVARLLALLNSPATNIWAERGLQRLRAADFRKDWRLVLEKESLLRATVGNAAAALQAMPPDKLEPLAAVLPPATGQLLRDSAHYLRERPGRPLVEALAPALDAYWEQYLQQQVRQALRSFTTAGK